MSMFLSSSLRRVIVPAAARAATKTPSHIFCFNLSSDGKSGMATPAELQAFIAAAGDRLVIADVRILMWNRGTRTQSHEDPFRIPRLDPWRSC